MKLFKTITIQTPESVELEFTLAGVGNRALALMVDYLVVFFLLSLVSVISSFLSEQLVNLTVVLGGGTEALDLWLIAIALIVTMTIYWGYFVGFEAYWQGQTPGKRLTKIRVINDNGKPEGIMQATLRSLLRPVDDILFLGFFCILFGEREKRIGDWLAGTLVVQAERAIGEANVRIAPASQKLAMELMNEADIGQLLPDDFATLREYLQRRTALTKAARQELSVKLARQLRDIIVLEKLPKEQLPAEQFLEAVYVAYQKKFGDRRRSYR